MTAKLPAVPAPSTRELEAPEEEEPEEEGKMTGPCFAQELDAVDTLDSLTNMCLHILMIAVVPVAQKKVKSKPALNEPMLA